MNYLSVKNFETYQHYKTKSITSWVKLYFNILDDYDFIFLKDQQKWIYVGLILLAGKTNNKIPLDDAYIKTSLRCSSTDINSTINKLIELGFVRQITDDIHTKSMQTIDNIYTKSRQSLDKVYTKSSPDKIREDKIRLDNTIVQSIDSKTDVNKTKQDCIVDSIKNKSEKFQETWIAFELMRQKVRKPLTNRAVELLLKKLEQLNSNEDEQIRIIEQSIMNGWQGFYEIKSVLSNKNNSLKSEVNKYDNIETNPE